MTNPTPGNNSNTVWVGPSGGPIGRRSANVKAINDILHEVLTNSPETDVNFNYKQYIIRHIGRLYIGVAYQIVGRTMDHLIRHTAQYLHAI